MLKMLKMLKASLLLLMVSACDCGPPACFDLVWNPIRETCDCPMGTMANYDLDRCEGPDGVVIPWTNVEPAARPSRPMMDGGVNDASPDVVISDAGPDVDSIDMGSQDMGDDASDAGVLPADVRARFPWNGFTTGSPHVANDALVADHPLRPRLMWDEAADADSYQVQMTRACVGTSFRTCDFARLDHDEMTSETTFRPAESLIVSLEAPVGSRYFWRVRACSALGCSAWSEIRYLDVGRDDHDFNGDGYADVVVGARNQNDGADEEGGVYVFLGGEAGTSTVAIEIDNPRNQANGHFGLSIAAPGDLNGDGFPDLVVGAPGQISPEVDAGSAYVFLGGASGPSTRPDRSIDSPSGLVGARFGKVTGGDVNGDGFADLMVGAEGVGLVYLFAGGSTGLPGTPTQTINNPTDQTDNGFGGVEVVGDINGDGFADLFASAPNHDGDETGSGVVYVFLGNGDGLPSTPLSIPSPASVVGGRFGVAMSGGDLNGDGFADVVVAHDRSVERVDVFAGSRSGTGDSPRVTLSNPTEQESSSFGIDVAVVGDVNGDGLADVVIGATGQANPSSGEGGAFVLLGATDWTQEWVTIDSPTDLRNGLFGIAVGPAGDLNGDGFADVVVGAASYERTFQGGRAYSFHGRPGGIRTAPTVEFDNPLATSFVEFGWSLVR